MRVEQRLHCRQVLTFGPDCNILTIAHAEDNQKSDMEDTFQQVKVAVVQAAPILFDRQATVKKVCQLLADAAAQGARLVLFPEAFIPAYPRGLGFGTVVGSRSPPRCLSTYRQRTSSAADGNHVWRSDLTGAAAPPLPGVAGIVSEKQHVQPTQPCGHAADSLLEPVNVHLKSQPGAPAAPSIVDQRGLPLIHRVNDISDVTGEARDP
jgi:hypothetical protein